MPDEYHKNGGSVDGTREFLQELSKQESKLVYVPSDGFWHSKDVQVNRAIEEVKKITNKCFLWEFDIDEQWTIEALNQAEKEMAEENVKVGAFQSECYIGKNLKPIGEWSGEVPARRLWNWEGEFFERHEPPTLFNCDNKKQKTLTPKFKHYNYYFDKDVKFKEKWYRGHNQIHGRWKLINSFSKEKFPMPLSFLITGYWGKTNSQIVWRD
jgi:hypothetical protein